MHEGSPLPHDTVAALREANAAVRATRSSADGAVTVTVNVHGEIDHVDLADGPSLDDLGHALLAATRRARAGAAREAADNVADRLGPDAPAARAVRGLVPEDDDDLDEFVARRPPVPVARTPRVTPAARPLVQWDDEPEDGMGFTRG